MKTRKQIEQLMEDLYREKNNPLISNVKYYELQSAIEYLQWVLY